MKGWIEYFCLIHLLHAQSSSFYSCPKCLGKIHSKEDLQLTKQTLIIDKKDLCRDREYPLVIIVKSGDIHRRNFTRFTWAKELNDHFNIPILYAIALPKNSSHQLDILHEDQLYHDLIEFNFEESYYNLTLKTISVFQWYDRWCGNHSQSLLYVDDDVLIHVDRLMMFIRQYNYNDMIQGWWEKSGHVQRSGIGGVSKKDFPLDIVPDYLWGAAVLYPSRIIRYALLPGIFNTTLPIFFRDDVFINGFIAEQMSIQRIHMKGIWLYDRTEDDLQSQMILINFDKEIQRYHTWDCFREKRYCNKNWLRLFERILSYTVLILILFVFLWKLFVQTKITYQMKYQFYRWYYGLGIRFHNQFSSMTRRSHSTVGLSQRRFLLRRISLPLIVLLFIILLLCVHQMKRD